MGITVDRTVIVQDTDNYLTFPVAGRLADGTLVAVWSDRGDHYDGKSSSTRAALSTDGGLTWQPPFTISPQPASPVSMASHPGGRLALLEMDEQPYRGWVRISSDGTTWTAPRAVTWDAPAGAWTYPCGLLWLDDGSADGLMLATSYGTGGILISASNDAGLTWQAWSALTANPYDGGFGESETVIAETAGGDLLMLTRVYNRSDSSRVVVSRRSSDRGRSWTAPTTAYAGSGMPAMTVMPSGVIVATVRDTRGVTAQPSSWTLAMSTDDGRTWTLHPVSDGWMMYGQVVPTAGTAAVLVSAHQVRGSQTDNNILALHLTITDAPASPRVDTVSLRREQRWVWGSFITGQIQGELRPLPGSSWSQSVDETSITLKLSTNSEDWVPGMLSAIFPWRSFLAVIVGDEILAAGPYTHDTWDADSREITLHARGGEAYLDRREFMQLTAESQDWELYDRAKKEPKSWTQTTFNDRWPSIVSKVLTQMLSWKGQGIYAQEMPNIIAPPAGIYGNATTYRTLAMEHPGVGEILRDMEGHTEGVEWEVRPTWQSSPDEGIIQWQVLLGDPLIVTHGMASWSHDRVSNLRTSRDGRKLTTLYHASGGRAVDEPLHVTLRAGGSQLMLETHDSSFGNVRTRTDLAREAVQRFRVLSRPILDYAFSVPLSTVSAWRPGDFALLTGDPTADMEYDAVLPHLPRETRLRILARSGSADSELVSVKTQRLAPEDDDAWLQTY